MDATRRQFLFTAGAGLAAAWAGCATGPGLRRAEGVAGPATGTLPILQGPSDATSASFLVQHPVDRTYAWRARGPAGPVPVSPVERFDVPGQPVAVTELLATGLVPGVDYTLEGVGPGGEVLDAREFRSFDTGRKALKFAVCSCMNDRFVESGRAVWEAMARVEPDVVFLVGDTVYADQNNWTKDEAGFARRYVEARDRLPWSRMPRLVPTFATWDDHDFGANDGDKSFARAPFLRTLFRRFFGTTVNGAWTRAHGVGGVLRAGGQRFYLLDDRTFRDAPRTKLGRHLGDAQREWLLADLASSAEPAWLMNGSQFFGGYHGLESYERDHPDEFAELLSKLSALAAPVAFVAGDVHYSELMAVEPARLGYATYELTASSIHSFAVPYMDRLVSNPRRLASDARYNFLAVDTRVGATWQAGVRCVTGDGVAFERALEIVRG